MGFYVDNYGVTFDPSGINTTYGQETLLELKTSNALISSSSSDGLPTVGNCVSGQMNITMKRVSAAIPKMSKMNVFIVVNNVTIPKGTYFIDTREYDTAENTIYATDTMTIHGYDAMMMFGQSMYTKDGSVYESAEDWDQTKAYSQNDIVAKGDYIYKAKQNIAAGTAWNASLWDLETLSWPAKALDVVDLMITRFSSASGVTLDSGTRSLMTSKEFYINFPGYGDDGPTCRDVLGYIGSTYGGNWIITDSNTLKLIQLNENKVAKTGVEYESCTVHPNNGSYTKVTVQVNNDTEISSGTDTGLELKVYCPLCVHSEDASDIAEYVLGLITNYTYTGFDAQNVLYDPTWVLGDKITIGDTTSYIYSLDIDFDAMMSANVGSPYDSELEHEYQYKDQGSKTLRKTLDQFKTSFKIVQGEISSVVSGQIHTYYGTLPVDTEFHVGDLFYSVNASGSYKANTWYRYTYDTDDDSYSWVETTSSVAVAPPWDQANAYSKDDVVEKDGKWYRAKQSIAAGTAWDSSKWEECTTITQVAQTQINQNIDGLTLTVTRGSSGMNYSLTHNGFTITSNTVSKGLDWSDLPGITSANSTTFISDAVVYSPTIMAGLDSSGAVNINSEGINFGRWETTEGVTRLKQLIGLGYSDFGSGTYILPTITLGEGIGETHQDRGMIRKYAEGIWIGDSDDIEYYTVNGSGTANGVYIDFTASTFGVYTYQNGTKVKMGTATFGA